MNNYRYGMDSTLLLGPRPTVRTSPIWKEFIEYHTSAAFFGDFVRVFQPALAKYRPDLIAMAEKKNKTLSDLLVTAHKAVKSDLLSKTELVVNSPVMAKSRVRGPHHDKLNEIYAGLLYFRRPNDNSVGGSFQVYKCKGNCSKVPNDPKLKRALGLSIHGRHEQYDIRTIQLMREVPYR